ncbi:hypothetical protein BDY21DRAFT_386280 [Lineolata rhizophorae]|uniref:LYC1 C-terminal domain-containing protein n=1 Tax=Lineolata rhizophorae TaxID=578093 RepID=A0A6A6NZB8_9PEZI|nr:hypothetical protein BDY21DRAFT_386280 [Lineolata rhizophorae]
MTATAAFNTLPPANAPTITLTHPTASERLAIWRENGAHWRGALSLEAYLVREQHLAEQSLTSNGGITWWALVSEAGPRDSDGENSTAGRGKRLVLAACETFRKRALVGKDGVVHEAVAHGIGSVFTPVRCRGKGYAGRMMGELGERLKTWQAGEGGQNLFSVLYSDIGKEFYAKYGWTPYVEPFAWIPYASNTRPNGFVSHLPTSKPLYKADLAALCTSDEAALKSSLERRSTNSSKTVVALIPDEMTMDWLHAREDFVALELYSHEPLIKGAIVGSKEGHRAWAVWTRMWYTHDPQKPRHENVLYVLRLVVEDGVEDTKETVAALLEAARSEAEKWEMSGVEVWNPRAEVIDAAKLVSKNTGLIEREKESIASLRWNGDAAEEVEWVANEKFGWC